MAYNNEFDGNDVGMELDWNAEIEKDRPEFILLPEGDYDFEVISFERARYNGGEKLPACNQAKLQLKVAVPEGVVTIRHNLFLHTRREGLLSAFFLSIGKKRHGEKVQMDWNKVIGAKGRGKVGIKTYEGKQYNEIKRFLEPEASTPPRGFKAGKF